MEYNSMSIFADEMGAFIHKYDNEMIDGLSAFYDPTPYQQVRRTSDLRIKIESPQINMLCGCTPQNLTDLMMPEGLGPRLYLRLIMIFSDERIIGDDFAEVEKTYSADLAHDLEIINEQIGQFEVTQAYKDAVNNWRASANHQFPVILSSYIYVTRRRTHLYKLSMVSAIDRSNALIPH